MNVILGKLLRERGWCISVAESCTGGLLSHKITNVPGASSYFLGSVVVYSNTAKKKLLGVKEDTLQKHGAVSAQCAREMVVGVTSLFNTEVGISTTGIAGPGGGVENKPVGLVYIGVKTPQVIEVHRYIFSGKREEIKEKIVKRALEIVIRIIEK